jgi:nucleoside-diphosphate-sugar epimerase
MAGELILLTGGSGHVGFRVLQLALEAGYNVRVAVRNLEKAATLGNSAQLKSKNATSSLNFITVPDLTVPGAYDEAAKGVKYIIHIASPLASSNSNAFGPEMYEEGFINPAVKGTIGILESAKKAGTVHRVIITSSLGAIVPFSHLRGEPTDTIFTDESRIPTPNGPFRSIFEAYSASKTKAFNDSEAWLHREKPAFDVIHLHPSYVIGRHDLQTTREGVLDGTNALVLNIILGGRYDRPVPGATVHLDDVARTHVQALDHQIPGNRSYILSSNNPINTLNGTNLMDAISIVAKNFPDKVAKGILPNNGSVQSIAIKLNAKPTEETFQFKHLTYDEQVKSVVGHFLEIDANGV